MLALPAHAQARNGYEAFVELWNRLRRIVRLEEREGGKPPLDEQIIRMRTEFVPMLTGRLEREMTAWLDDAEEVAAERPGRFGTLKPVLAEVKKRRIAGTTANLVPKWMTLPEAKKLETWIPGLAWDPLMTAVEREITDAEDLLVMMGWRIELRHEARKVVPDRAQLWWRLVKPDGLERAEQELHRRVQAARHEPIQRKRWLVVRMRRRNEQWLIERWEWLDR